MRARQLAAGIEPLADRATLERGHARALGGYCDALRPVLPAILALDVSKRLASAFDSICSSKPAPGVCDFNVLRAAQTAAGELVIGAPDWWLYHWDLWGGVNMSHATTLESRIKVEAAAWRIRPIAAPELQAALSRASDALEAQLTRLRRDDQAYGRSGRDACRGE